MLTIGYGDTFHLDEPLGTAHGGESDDGGDVRETRSEEVAHRDIVGRVAQIDRDLRRMFGEIHLGFGQKRIDVFPHAVGLAHDVADVHHLSFVVDRSRAADEHMRTIAVFDHGAALESHPIFDGGIEVCEGIQVALLPGRQAFHRISAELHERTRVGRQTTDAGRRNVVRVGRQPHAEEVVKTRFDQTRIVGVDVAHEKPSAHAVVGDRGALRCEFVLIACEQSLGLCCRIARRAFHAHVPKVAITAVFHRGDAVGALHLHAREEINPQADFRTVERRLLNYGDGARGFRLHERSLVGGVAHEVAFEHGARIGGQQFGANTLETTLKASILLGETLVLWADMELNVVLARAKLGDIGRKSTTYAHFFPSFLQKVHCFERRDARRLLAFSQSRRN